MNKINSMDKSCLTLHTVTAIITVWSEGFYETKANYCIYYLIFIVSFYLLRSI